MKSITKCPLCKGKMEKVKSNIKKDNVEFEAYKCKDCGEELVNMDQLKDLASKYRKMRQAKSIKFRKWGNSLAVRIPSEYVNDLNLSEGKEAFLYKDKEGMKIEVN